jgi:hypothetical protein
MKRDRPASPRGWRFSAVCAAALWGAAAEASCGANACTSTIQRLYVDDGQVAIWLAGGTAGLTNCTPSSGVYVMLNASDPNYASKYAMLLSAYLAGQVITLRTSDSPGAACHLAYAYVGA